MWSMDVKMANAGFTAVLIGQAVNGVGLMVDAPVMTIVNAPLLNVMGSVLYNKYANSRCKYLKIEEINLLLSKLGFFCYIAKLN